MSEAVKAALEEVYTALHANNQGLDGKIAALKSALATAGMKEATVEKERLPQNNRQGRKMLQTYFKKRGVVVVFNETATSEA